jgi:mRNA interferase MazF
VKRGDTIIVTHGEFGRPRPAVIVQADELGAEPSTVLVCPITSQLTERLPVRPLLEPETDNGLRLRSQIMTDKMFAVRRTQVRRVLGALDKVSLERLDRALLVVLGLATSGPPSAKQ